MNECVSKLMEHGKSRLSQPYKRIPFTGDDGTDAADELVNDLERFPHAFVLACLMDRGVKAERAWRIPHRVAVELGDFEFSTLVSLDAAAIRDLFVRNGLHRYPTKMADIFHLAIQRIHDLYYDDASNIWKDTPPSATLVRRFLGFKGAGIKIATMAANILVREFKIPVADKRYIDISPDVQVKRVFERLALIELGSTTEELVYCARELNPDYPGVFDALAWDIGKKWCKPRKPVCAECKLGSCCPKVGVGV